MEAQLQQQEDLSLSMDAAVKEDQEQGLQRRPRGAKSSQENQKTEDDQIKILRFDPTSDVILEKYSPTAKKPAGTSVDERSCGLIYPTELYQEGATDFGDLIDETEYDVETVVKNQNTHDLICPNCQSCITRSVILRRKLKTKLPFRRPPHRRPRPGPDSNGDHRRGIEEPEPEPEPAFRCLSCFSFFIPSGSGFKILDIFRGRSKTEEEAPPPITPFITGDYGGVIYVPVENDPSRVNVVPVRDFTGNDIDILKSIVYGGLIESITSLSIVSSAAGAGAATLNIFALALANLVGGLFVLAHNLKGLKNDSGGIGTQDRYYTSLGTRGRFTVHATLAVLSYVIFGLVAPITYGFSFRESDDRYYKLATVAAVSLFCIFLLALAKARVKDPPRSYALYAKTVFEYLSWGVAASGISVLVGVFLDKLFEQLGWFTSTSSVTAPLMELELARSGSGWGSY